MLNIVFLDRYTVSNSDLSGIEKLGNFTCYDNTQVSEIIERSIDADVVIINKVPFREETLKALPKLKLVCIAATGMNNIDKEAATAMGITVINTADYSTYAVAEATFCGVLALMKQTLYYDSFIKDGRYAASDRLFDFGRHIYQLHGKKWGVIGMGNIGRKIAEIATAFGAEVSYYSTSGNNNNAGYLQKSLEELLAWSDIVSIHAPLSRVTYNLIDYPQMKLMKSSALLANYARGNIVNEEGLTRALNENVIAGAALDVFSKEPINADNPLFEVKDKYKLLLSPHTAWAAVESLQVLADKIADNIKNHFNL